MTLNDRLQNVAIIGAAGKMGSGIALLMAQEMTLQKLQAENRGGTVRFGPRAAIDPVVLIAMVEDQPEIYSLDGPFKLRFRWELALDEDRIGAAEQLLLQLGATSETSAAA